MDKKGLKAFQWPWTQKPLKNLVKVEWDKKQVDSENLEGGEVMKQRGRLLGETWREDTKSHLNVF
jgi:hypothetical protein